MSKDDENVDVRFFNFGKSDENALVSKNSLDNKDISDFNSDRLRFYVELNKLTQNNPKILKKLTRKYNNISYRKANEKLIFKSINNNIDKYKGLKGESDGTGDPDNIISKEIKDKIKDNLKISGGGNLKEYFNEGDDEKLKEFDNIINKDNDGTKNFIKLMKNDYEFKNVEEKDDKELDNPIQTFIDEFYTANNEYNKSADELTLKKSIVEAVDKFDNNDMNTLDILEIKNDDRIVFMAMTFAIRYVTLLLVYWCVDIDMIKSFNEAFMLFTLIYIIIFWFIVMIINVNISPDSLGDSSIIGKIQSVLYYFYFKINGIGRLLIHTLFILLLLIIPVIIKS
jgi:hypothetical protein